MGVVEEHVKLTNKIMAGELTYNQVKNEIDRIESQYGEDSFGSYKVKKTSAPWSMKDLEDLEVQSVSGACSKEFYLYMAEVSEFVYKKNKNIGLIGRIEQILKFIAKNWLIVLVIIGVVILIWWAIARFAG